MKKYFQNRNPDTFNNSYIRERVQFSFSPGRKRKTPQDKRTPAFFFGEEKAERLGENPAAHGLRDFCFFGGVRCGRKLGI